MFEKIKQYWVAFISLGLLAVSGLFVAQKQEMFGAGYNPVTGYTSKTTSYVSPTATTIPVVSTKDPSGRQIDLSKISDAPVVKVYMNIEPGTPNQEPIMCTGLTVSSWTGCTRGLEFQGGSETASTTLQKAHNAGSAIIITNIGQSFNQFVAISGDQSIGGVKNFTEFPTFNTSTQLPSQDEEFATKYYVDQVGAGGFTAANVSTTRGLSVDGSVPERVGINASSTTGMAFDAQGRLYQAISSTLSWSNSLLGVSESGFKAAFGSVTASAGKIPFASSTGYLDSSWLNPGSNGQFLSLSAGQFSWATLQPIVLYSSFSTTTQNIANTSYTVSTTIPANTLEVGDIVEITMNWVSQRNASGGNPKYASASFSFGSGTPYSQGNIEITDANSYAYGSATRQILISSTTLQTLFSTADAGSAGNSYPSLTNYSNSLTNDITINFTVSGVRVSGAASDVTSIIRLYLVKIYRNDVD